MTPPLPAEPFTAVAAGQRYAAYAALAKTGSVHHVTMPSGAPAWLVTGYDEVRQALSDPRLVRGQPTHGPLIGHLPRDVAAGIYKHMLYSNPPDHTRLRRLVSAAFTRRRMEQLKPRIQQIASTLLDELGDADETDLIASFAYPLPMNVICELLGIPEDARSTFHDRVWTILSGQFAGKEAYLEAVTGMVTYIQGLLADKRRGRADDLISALVMVRDGEDQLDEDELSSTVFLLVTAGHETTLNLIGNGVHALLTHPEQLALLRAEPDRMDAAVEELLRFAGPAQVAPPLVTTEPVELGGVKIPAGNTVFPSLLAANRDPAHLPDATVLDIDRSSCPNLGFGHGIHYCLAASLGRLEVRIALSMLLSRFPKLRLAVAPHELVWHPSVLAHALQTLPVALR